MKKSLAKFRLLLEGKGVEVEDIRFNFNGKVLFIGFRAIYGKVIVEVEPRYDNVWGVQTTSILPNEDYFDRRTSFIHYAKRREGFYPSLCRPYSLMKKEIIQALKMESKNIWKTQTGMYRLYSDLHGKFFDFDTCEAADTFRDYIVEAEKWFERPTLKNVEDRRLFCQRENLFLNIEV